MWKGRGRVRGNEKDSIEMGGKGKEGRGEKGKGKRIM